VPSPWPYVENLLAARVTNEWDGRTSPEWQVMMNLRDRMIPPSSSNYTSESSTRKHRLMLFSSVHTKAESVKMMQGDNGVSRIDVLFNMSLIQTQNFDTNNSTVSFCNFIGCFPTSDSMPKSLYVLPALARYTGGFLYKY